MKRCLQEAIKWAVIGNLLHLILSNIFAYTFNLNPSLYTAGFIALVLLWFAVGFAYSYKLKGLNEFNYLTLGFISLLPLTVYLTACQLLEGVGGLSEVANYSLFYFLGIPVIMWNKPFLPVMNLFKNSSIYIQFDINAVIIFFVIFLGAYTGGYFNKITSKKSNSNKSNS